MPPTPTEIHYCAEVKVIFASVKEKVNLSSPGSAIRGLGAGVLRRNVSPLFGFHHHGLSIHQTKAIQMTN